jgi:hypothetical protein
MHKIITIFLLFLFIFGIPFYNIPMNSSKLIVVYLIIHYFIINITSKSLKSTFNKELLYIGLWILLLIGLSLLSNLLNHTNDFYIAYSFLLMLIETLLGSYLIYQLYLKRYSFKELLDIYIIIALLQSLIIIGMFISEGFRNFIYLIANLNAEQLAQRYGGFRGFGLAGSVTYDLAFLLSMSMIFITYILSFYKEKKVFYIISWFFIFIAVAMTGRTGWFGVALSLLVFLVNIKNKNTLLSIMKFIFFLLIGIVSFVYILKTYNIETYNILILKVIPYVFEMFINFYETGSFSTHSTEALGNMYFLPELKTLLVGDGYFNAPQGQGMGEYYYMDVDPGYLRMVLFYGIFSSAVLYGLYIYLFYILRKYTFNYKGFTSIVTMLFIYYFVVQWKGSVLSNSGMNIKFLFVLVIYSILKYNRKLKNV